MGGVYGITEKLSTILTLDNQTVTVIPCRPVVEPRTTDGAMNVIDKARTEGLLLTGANRGMSAKDLREQNPELAARWAAFIAENKTELVKEIAGRVAK